MYRKERNRVLVPKILLMSGSNGRVPGETRGLGAALKNYGLKPNVGMYAMPLKKTLYIQ